MSDCKFKYLDSINLPEDLRKLDIQELKDVCKELREFLIDCVSQTGGHLGAGLGAVELAVALHYAFNTPQDKIIWDVGHQAYPHKILTGRKNKMHTIRQLGGLSGFLKRSESEYDVFGGGHASTAISAALGIATARDLSNENFKVVAVMGDGSMTGGLAYEAMNNAGILKKDMIVVLNDNQMGSLSSKQPKIWSFHHYFTELLINPRYNKLKADIWNLTTKMDTWGDRIRKLAQQMEKGIKAIITPGMLFEALSFRYFGPINGHNVIKLVETFKQVKDMKGPILIHVITEKGKGYEPAEREATRLHGVTPFDKVTGIAVKNNIQNTAYTDIFGDAIVEICKQNPKVVGITAAMPDGTGLIKLHENLPDRFFDVGIAESHAVVFAAGMATEGYIPVVAIYSTFLQRAFDQIVHDCAIQNLHVVFVLDRGGLVGADGATHHGALDLSYLRCIPNMVIMAPKDEQELRDMLFTAIEYKKGPIALRYPRNNTIGIELRKDFKKLDIGKAEVIRKGSDIALLAVGNMVGNALTAAQLLSKEGIEAEVVNMRFVKPVDEDLIAELAKRINVFVTLEDNVVEGGFGSGVMEALSKMNISNVSLKIHGLPSEFIEQGTINELHKMLKMDDAGICEVAKEFLKNVQDESSKIKLNTL